MLKIIQNIPAVVINSGTVKRSAVSVFTRPRADGLDSKVSHKPLAIEDIQVRF